MCKSFEKKKIPPCSTANGMGFPNVPDNLKDLHQVEWRLVSPRIPFMKVFAAPRGGQKKIRGNVVNVPCDTTTTFQVLPKPHNEEKTIQVKIKRDLKYTNHVMSENVRPYKVRQAAEFLVKHGKLFKEQGIVLDESWDIAANEEVHDSQVDETEASETESIDNLPVLDSQNEIEELQPDDLDSIENRSQRTEDTSKDKNKTDKARRKIKRNRTQYQKNVEINDEEWSENEDGENRTSGLLDTMFTAPDFLEDEERDLQYIFAPGQGRTPVSIFKDKYSEELAYPNIYCGQSRPDNKNRKVPVYYSEICKSELRHEDRRVAQDPDNLFFKTIKFR